MVKCVKIILKLIIEAIIISLIQHFEESQPQNPEFRIDPENFHPCNFKILTNLQMLAIRTNDIACFSEQENSLLLLVFCYL